MMGIKSAKVSLADEPGHHFFFHLTRVVLLNMVLYKREIVCTDVNICYVNLMRITSGSGF